MILAWYCALTGAYWVALYDMVVAANAGARVLWLVGGTLWVLATLASPRVRRTALAGIGSALGMHLAFWLSVLVPIGIGWCAGNSIPWANYKGMAIIAFAMLQCTALRYFAPVARRWVVVGFASLSLAAAWAGIVLEWREVGIVRLAMNGPLQGKVAIGNFAHFAGLAVLSPLLATCALTERGFRRLMLAATTVTYTVSILLSTMAIPVVILLAGSLILAVRLVPAVRVRCTHLLLAGIVTAVFLLPACLVGAELGRADAARVVAGVETCLAAKTDPETAYGRWSRIGVGRTSWRQFLQRPLLGLSAVPGNSLDPSDYPYTALGRHSSILDNLALFGLGWGVPFGSFLLCFRRWLTRHTLPAGVGPWAVRTSRAHTLAFWLFVCALFANPYLGVPAFCVPIFVGLLFLAPHYAGQWGARGFHGGHQRDYTAYRHW